jgi:hypothetical protein
VSSERHIDSGVRLNGRGDDGDDDDDDDGEGGAGRRQT